jgi:ABC-type phosphate transport system auxiliary subunit
MITRADFEKLFTEAETLKAEVNELRKVNVEAIKADYEKQIDDLKAEVELLKTEEAIVATEVYKNIVAKNEENEKTISSLQEQMKSLEVNKEENLKMVNTMVAEKLASVGISPIKVQTEKQETKKKVVFSNADEYFSSIK